MKSTTSVINGILAVAIIVLFVLHFNNKSTPSTPASVKNGSGQIAYFEIDSIQNNYELFKEVKAALQLKDQQNQTTLTALKNDYIGSSAAYIISREGINKLLKFAKYNNSYFKLDKKNNLDLSDIYIYKYLDTIVYKYNYIGTKNIELTDNQQQNEDKNNLFQLNIIIKDFHNKTK